MSEMARMGRPELPPEEVRNKRVNFMAREDEHKDFQEAAEAEGLSMADWIRSVLVPAARRAKKKANKKT